MRDVIVSLALISLFPACFRRPFVGLIVFSWLAYMRVQDLTWGFARGMRWSYYVAVITFAGYVVNSGGRFFAADIRSFIMLTMVVLVSTSVALSERPDAETISRLLEYVKIVVIALFTTVVVKTREHLRILMWVIALSLGFYGVKSGVWGILTFGGGVIKQGPGGMLADNNDFALALAMAVPLLVNVGLSEKRDLLRRAFFITVPLTMITIVLTHSRGGFLSLTGAIGVMVWRSKNRVAGVVIGMLIGLCALVLAPASYKERIASIADYKSEGSAQARFASWAVAYRMAMAHPILGVGLGKFTQHYMRHEPNPTAQQRAGFDIFVAHNSYLQIWAECGTMAFLLYWMLLFISFFTIWRTRARAKRLYYSSWIINYATGMEASLVAFMIGSTFLNRAHFDLFYHFVAVVCVFGVIAQREMDTPVKVRKRKDKRRVRGELVAVEGGGFGSRPVRRGFRNTPLLPREA